MHTHVLICIATQRMVSSTYKVWKVIALTISSFCITPKITLYCPGLHDYMCCPKVYFKCSHITLSVFKPRQADS